MYRYHETANQTWLSVKINVCVFCSLDVMVLMLETMYFLWARACCWNTKASVNLICKLQWSLHLLQSGLTNIWDYSVQYSIVSGCNIFSSVYSFQEILHKYTLGLRDSCEIFFLHQKEDKTFICISKANVSFIILSVNQPMEWDYLTSACLTTVSSSLLLLPSPGTDDLMFTPR